MDRRRASSARHRVQPGGPLRNAYRGQGTANGRPYLPGFVSVGDAVATTTPTFGRGLATTFLQLEALLSLIDGGEDPRSVGEEFDGWCEANMLPWARLPRLEVDVHMDGPEALQNPAGWVWWRMRHWLGSDGRLLRDQVAAAQLRAAARQRAESERIARFQPSARRVNDGGPSADYRAARAALRARRLSPPPGNGTDRSGT